MYGPKFEAIRADANAIIDEMVEVRWRHAVGESGQIDIDINSDGSGKVKVDLEMVMPATLRVSFATWFNEIVLGR